MKRESGIAFNSSLDPYQHSAFSTCCDAMFISFSEEWAKTTGHITMKKYAKSEL